jgi:hypothetical protein
VCEPNTDTVWDGNFALSHHVVVGSYMADVGGNWTIPVMFFETSGTSPSSNKKNNDRAGMTQIRPTVAIKQAPTSACLCNYTHCGGCINSTGTRIRRESSSTEQSKPLPRKQSAMLFSLHGAFSP